MISKTMEDQTYLKGLDPQSVSQISDVCPMCEGKTELEDVFLPKSDLDDYKINREYYTPIDALDIKKTRESWIALLYCDSVKGYGKSFRLYMWRMRKGEKIWKLTLCNFPADNNMAMPINIQRVLKFIQKHRSDV